MQIKRNETKNTRDDIEIHRKNVMCYKNIAQN